MNPTPRQTPRTPSYHLGKTWIEAEELAYSPRGSQIRRCLARCEDGALRVVRAGIPDTAFTVPAHCTVAGHYTHGYITSDEGEFTYHADLPLTGQALADAYALTWAQYGKVWARAYGNGWIDIGGDNLKANPKLGKLYSHGWCMRDTIRYADARKRLAQQGQGLPVLQLDYQWTLLIDLPTTLGPGFAEDDNNNWYECQYKPEEKIAIRERCPECGRVFDLLNATDAQEWAYGHDCEA